MTPAVWLAVGLVAWLAIVLPASAQQAAEDIESPDRDCRYADGYTTLPSDRAGTWTGVPFPGDDVFRALLADPKQPQFFASWQALRVRDESTSANIGSVGFGENFGLWGYRKNGSCDGVQVGLLGGVFSQFNLDAPSSDLINTDFVIGIPVSWRSGAFSSRVRFYHQSSHLGDEFLLGSPGIPRVNLSFEEVEALLAYDYWWVRVYAGGGYLIHREPPGLDRLRAQWGIEFRGPAQHWSLLEKAIKGSLAIIPVFGADFKTIEELNWVVNSNVVGGIEWFRVGSTRRFRLLINYYRGFNPYGQFFAQKIESVGVGLYLAF